MPRPTLVEITSGDQGWDADVTDNFRSAWKVATPIANGTLELADGSEEGSAYTDASELPAAASNEGCLAAVDNGGAWELYLSTGSAWERIGVQAVDPGDSAATNTSEMVADFNELLANLRTAGLIA